jgi:flagellum-specific peptidoglycan hydrolase FlgJ
MLRSEFISAIRDAAQSAMRAQRVPASVTIAQAILESAWGQSGLALEGHNLFGIKADASWTGDIITMPTHEFLDHQLITVQAKFRKYPDWNGSIHDHAQFLVSNPRYHDAFKSENGEQFAHAIAQAGYATDPKYAAMLVTLMGQYGLASYDKAA